jgi:hypothetical protein
MAPLRILVDEKPLEALIKGDIGSALELLVQGHHHPLQQLAPPADRVGEQPDGDLVVEAAQQLAHQRGLAAADPAGDDGDTRLAQDAVFEHRIGHLVAGRPIQKIGIRHDGERLFREIIERFVHSTYLASRDTTPPREAMVPIEPSGA